MCLSALQSSGQNLSCAASPCEQMCALSFPALVWGYEIRDVLEAFHKTLFCDGLMFLQGRLDPSRRQSLRKCQLIPVPVRSNVCSHHYQFRGPTIRVDKNVLWY